VDFSGNPVHEVPDLQRNAAAAVPGQVVKLVVVRDRTRLPMDVTVGEMPIDEPVAEAEPDQAWGLTVESLGGDPARRLSLPFSHGVVVTEVIPGSPADRAGLRRGDIILDVTGRPIVDAAAFHRELAALKPGDVARLYVHRPSTAGGPGNQFFVLQRPSTP
jgi:serine protease Do